MVKALFLGLLAATMCVLIDAAPAPQITQSNLQEALPSSQTSLEDPTARSERSTNLSNIFGTERKIQMYINNKHLQILPGGIVNGTTDFDNTYTILKRTTVGIGQLKIQGLATCQYLCMDSCGFLYGSRIFVDDCVFNEMIEINNYNTYSSKKYSNERRTLYLALNKYGQSRKVLLKARQKVGKLATVIRVLTHFQSKSTEESDHPIRHQAHLCSASTVDTTSNADPPVETQRCTKRKKKKKKKRRCKDGESESELCQKRRNTKRTQNKNKKCENEDSDECQRVEVTLKKKQKTKFSDKHVTGGARKKNKKHQKGVRNKKLLRTSTEATVVTEEVPPDDDYAMDTTTAWDWYDSTPVPEEIASPGPD